MNWLQRLTRTRQLEDQLDKEIDFHIEEHAAGLIARGVDPVEARRRARLELGGREQVKEAARDARGTLWLKDLIHDFRHAARVLLQKPGFTAMVVCTLALGPWHRSEHAHIHRAQRRPAASIPLPRR